MKKTSVIFAAAAMAALFGAGPAGAQPQPQVADVVTIAGVGTVTVLTYQARFVSGDPATGRAVLEAPNGKRWAVFIPPAVADIGTLQNGQLLTIRVLPAVVTALGKAHQGKPGEVISAAALSAGPVALPDGYGMMAVTLTTIFVDVNKANGTITFEGPDGMVRTVRAIDAKVLADLQKVEPGDLAQISYIEGVSIVGP